MSQNMKRNEQTQESKKLLRLAPKILDTRGELHHDLNQLSNTSRM